MEPSAVTRLRSALAGRYTLERELGRGGMATVWLARDLKHDRLVALKVLHPELTPAIDPERFLSEITRTAGLDHPHILRLLDSGEAAGFVHYASPYVEDESLRDRLNREKQLPIDDALTITRNVADALGYAHSRGVVHGNINPHTIRLVGTSARVADFVIARALAESDLDPMTAAVPFAQMLFERAYASPERVRGSRPDGRTDLYALGCVLYEMLAGHPPFSGRLEEVMLAHLQRPVPRLGAVRRVPPHVERAVNRLLAKRLTDRFESAAALSAALVPALAGIGTGALVRIRTLDTVAQGSLVGVVGEQVLLDNPLQKAVLTNRIETVWLKSRETLAGAMVGAVLALGAGMFGTPFRELDPALSSLLTVILGAGLGALVGSLVKTWHRRFSRTKHAWVLPKKRDSRSNQRHDEQRGDG